MHPQTNEERPAKKLRVPGNITLESLQALLTAYLKNNIIRLSLAVIFLIAGIIMCLLDNTPNVRIGSIVAPGAEVYDINCNVGGLMVLGGILLALTTNFSVKYDN